MKLFFQCYYLVGVGKDVGSNCEFYSYALSELIADNHKNIQSRRPVIFSVFELSTFLMDLIKVQLLECDKYAHCGLFLKLNSGSLTT
jgi:hypothetical protein